jgi:hypothetical protein
LTVLFTASTDYTGNVPDGGYSYPNNPTDQNPYLPAISSGVTLSSAAGGFSNTTVGSLPDGTTYGPSGFNQNAGGTTGWVTTSYTFTNGGIFQLIWEVANSSISSQGGDALTTDHITLTPRNGSPTELFPFQPGTTGTLPPGFTGLGNYGTSPQGGVPGLAPSAGFAFGWIDVLQSIATGLAPLFDTSGDVDSASRLYSASFTAQAGDTLSLDVAFLTSDGSPYSDYGIVAVAAVVPEPSNLLVAAVGILGMVGYAAGRRLQAGRRRAKRLTE